MMDEPRIIVVRVDADDRAEGDKQRKAATRLAIDTLGWLRFVQGVCLAYALIMLFEWLDEETSRDKMAERDHQLWQDRLTLRQRASEGEHGDVDARPLPRDN